MFDAGLACAGMGQTLYTATIRQQGGLSTCMTDLESLVYVAIMLAGGSLPWGPAVSQGLHADAMDAREHLLQHPDAECLHVLPPAVDSFAVAVLSAAATAESHLPNALTHLATLSGLRELTSAAMDKSPQVQTAGAGHNLTCSLSTPSAQLIGRCQLYSATTTK